MRFSKLFILSVVIVYISSCAPKKIRIYEDLPEKRRQIVEFSISLIGRPYESGAKGPDKFDCSGLIHYVYRSINVVLPLTVEGLMKVGRDITREDLRPGDIVFFREKAGLHAGIMVNKRDFIHASKRRGVGIDSIDSPYWKSRIIGFKSVIF